METKVKKLYDYINKLSFSAVIELYNSLSRAIADSTDACDNYAMMYDYTRQNDAEAILMIVGVERFLNKLTTKEREERAFYCDFDCDYFCNPWEEFMERAEEFINYIKCCDSKDYADIRKAVSPSVKVKVAVTRTITNVVEIEAVSHVDALDYVAKRLEKFDPMNVDENCIIVSEINFEVVPN